jgi:hypothetical protein
MNAVIVKLPRTRDGRDFLRAAMRAEINNEGKRLRLATEFDWDRSAALTLEAAKGTLVPRKGRA